MGIDFTHRLSAPNRKIRFAPEWPPMHARCIETRTIVKRCSDDHKNDQSNEASDSNETHLYAGMSKSLCLVECPHRY
jgi:hypothetical protein